MDPESVQLGGVKLPFGRLVLKLTLPDGVMNVPGDVSVTVAVHVVTWLIVTLAGEQAMTVEVLRFVTVTDEAPELPE